MIENNYNSLCLAGKLQKMFTNYSKKNVNFLWKASFRYYQSDQGVYGYRKKPKVNYEGLFRFRIVDLDYDSIKQKCLVMICFTYQSAINNRKPFPIDENVSKILLLFYDTVSRDT